MPDALTHYYEIKFQSSELSQKSNLYGEMFCEWQREFVKRKKEKKKATEVKMTGILEKCLKLFFIDCDKKDNSGIFFFFGFHLEVKYAQKGSKINKRISSYYDKIN